MYQCPDCKVFFFLIKSLKEHQETWCIGYVPNNINRGTEKMHRDKTKSNFDN